MSSSGNRAATNLQLKHRTATRNTKAASSKKSIPGKTCRVRFQSVNVISTHKSEPCHITSQASQELAAAFERGVTFWMYQFYPHHTRNHLCTCRHLHCPLGSALKQNWLGQKVWQKPSAEPLAEDLRQESAAYQYFPMQKCIFHSHLYKHCALCMVLKFHVN